MPVRETEFTCEFLSFVAVYHSWRAGQWFYKAAIGLDQRSSLRGLCDFLSVESFCTLYFNIARLNIIWRLQLTWKEAPSITTGEGLRRTKKIESLLAISLRHKLPPYDFYTQTKWVTGQQSVTWWRGRPCRLPWTLWILKWHTGISSPKGPLRLF